MTTGDTEPNNTQSQTKSMKFGYLLLNPGENNMLHYASILPTDIIPRADLP